MELRQISATKSLPRPWWDTVFNTDVNLLGVGDWVVAAPGEVNNPRGLQALKELETAILLCLFTDARRPDGVLSADGSTDRRGWYGDTFDIDTTRGEAELGSLLWTLDRAALTNETRLRAETYAEQSLQPLIRQGRVERFEIAAAVERGMMTLTIAAFAADGHQMIRNNYAVQ